MGRWLVALTGLLLLVGCVNDPAPEGVELDTSALPLCAWGSVGLEAGLYAGCPGQPLVCVWSGEGGVCAPLCYEDNHCSEGEVCVTTEAPDTSLSRSWCAPVR